MRNNKKSILFFTCIVIMILIIMFIRKANLKTIEINTSSYQQEIDTTAFIIQKEDVISFKGQNNINLKIKEGTKVSLNTIIGNSRKTVINTQEGLELDIINWKIENDEHKDKNIFNKDLEKIDKEIISIEKKIKYATKKNRKDEVKELTREREQLENKKQVIEGAFRFAFTDKKKLIELRDGLKKDSAILEGNITPEKLNIEYPGYVFFQRDSFESILHRDLLGNISESYFLDILDNIKKNDKPTQQYNNEQIIKFIDDNKMYLVAKVPQDLFIEKEEQLRILRKDLDSSWQTKGENNLYSFIENRKDVLNQFPKVKIEYQDKIIWGYLLDVNKDDMKDEKIATIKLDTNNHHLVGERRVNIHLYDIEYKGYILPKSVIINKNNENGIVLLDNKNKKQFIKVDIEKETKDLVVLNPKENMDIKPGDLVLLNP